MHPLYVGTSGWTYSDWPGVFYPREVKAADRLSYYATQFDALEINATFYRLPSAAMIAAWNRRLPADFQLVVKGPRSVTHQARLVNCEAELAGFFEKVQQLHALRVVLWQLPPSLAKDMPRLEAFLGQLPATLRHAFEFRHVSWWDEDVAEVLAQSRAALVALSDPRFPASVLPTADFLYVRFHGMGKQPYKYDYSPEELASWAETLRPHLAERPVYAFFNNTFYANAPRNAATFRRMMQGGKVAG
jgi:uncharacterized protein YecE (DUF72 family)